MTPRERFLSVLNMERPTDRLPMVEWAEWWSLTLDRWRGDGLPENLSWPESLDYFGLDKLYCLMGRAFGPECPSPSYHGGPLVTDEKSYKKIKSNLFCDSIIEKLMNTARNYKEEHEKGEIIIRLWLDGFFWFPRELLGIEGHLFAFHDNPDLLHIMNSDLAEFNIRVINELAKVLIPEMAGFAEDMSYNHGPMISYDLFREFLLPYYQKVIPHIKKHGVKVFADSDGDITSMIPWMEEAGIEGVYPLERQAGVDLTEIRKKHPKFLMMGGYDKIAMFSGEAAMRAEFERLLPVMRSGGYIPSVDHQTPPQVSLNDYETYLKLFGEYAERAVK